MIHLFYEKLLWPQAGRNWTQYVSAENDMHKCYFMDDTAASHENLMIQLSKGLLSWVQAFIFVLWKISDSGFYDDEFAKL